MPHPSPKMNRPQVNGRKGTQVYRRRTITRGHLDLTWHGARKAVTEPYRDPAQTTQPDGTEPQRPSNLPYLEQLN